MTVTIDEIQRAYEETGAVAVAGEYFSTRYGTPHCCPMCALYAQKLGLGKTEAMVDETIGEDQDAENGIVQRLSSELGLSPGFVRGFIYGVDGSSPSHDDHDYRDGFKLGAAFRTHVLIGG